MELIDKADVVAEIKRIMDAENVSINSFEHHRNTSEKQRYNARMALLEHILSFLNTLKVKEVDLDEEIERFVKSEEFQKASGTIKVTNLLARHFFELGIQQSNHNKNEEKS